MEAAQQTNHRVARLDGRRPRQILPTATSPADTQSPPPDATSPAQGAGSGIGAWDGRVHAIPAIQLPLNATPPKPSTSARPTTSSITITHSVSAANAVFFVQCRGWL